MPPPIASAARPQSDTAVTVRATTVHLDGPPFGLGLATATGLRPAATTALIDRLTRKGLVERVRSEADRRQVIVQMTQRGAEQTFALYRPLVEEGRQLMSKLGESELTLMRDYLNALTELTDRHRGRLGPKAGGT